MSIKSKTIKVKDMVCSSCEKRIDRGLKNCKGVLSSKSSYRDGKTIVTYDESLCKPEDIINKIESLGYRISTIPTKDNYKDYIGIAGIILISLLILKLGQNSGSFDISESLSSNIGYLSLFVVGLFSSLHCIGMCGGIMMSQSITLDKGKKLDRLKPSLLYNFGRLISYTMLGGVVGGIGSVISLSITVQGLISFFAALFMIIMGFNLSGFKTFRKFSIKLPWSNCNKKKSKSPFIIGLANGIMPCGPLQTMQLYALATGSILTGALSMFFFALGTIPLMVSFGFIFNLLSKKNSMKFVKVSGIIIIILGISMAGRGLSLLGINLSLPNGNTASINNNSSENTNKAILADGKQIVKLTAVSRGYTPNVVYIQKGIPTELIIEGSKLTSCNREVVIPSLNIRQKLSSGDNIIKFTPEDNDINFSCWMGMLRGKIKVVDSLDSTIDESSSISDEDDYSDVTFYGLPLTKIPTDKLIKRTNLNGGSQSLLINSTKGDLEPAVIIAKDKIPMTLTFNVEDIPRLNGKYDIMDSTLSKVVFSFEIIDGKGDITIPQLEFGSYGIIKDNIIHSIIESTLNPSGINLENIRNKYF